MTDKDIIQVLQYIVENGSGACDKCPVFPCGKIKDYEDNQCGRFIAEKALDLINRQQAEIARLQKEVNLVSMQFQDIQELQEETRAEVERLNALLTTKNTLIEGLDLSIGYAYDRAIEEFAEKLKSKALTKWDYHDAVDVEDIDELVKEMESE